MKKIIIPIMLAMCFWASDASASRLYSLGGELGSASSGIEWTTTTGTIGTNISLQTGTKRSGAYALRTNPSGASSYIIHRVQPDGTGRIFIRMYLYIATAPSADTDILVWGDGTYMPQTIKLKTTSKLGLYNDVTQQGSDSGTLSASTWYCIQLDYADASADAMTAYLDTTTCGTTSFASGTGGDIAGGGIFWLGVTDATTADLYFDDIAVNSEANPGQSSQTSLPGEGRFAILVPTASGASACTSGTYDDVDEIPPTNAGSSPGVEQCELDVNPTNGLFNMTDSSTAGIDSYDTITLVDPLLRVREDTVGTTNYTIRVNSNGGTASASASVDAGDATTVRTNPTGTTAFTNRKVMYRDPTTLSAWTPTGTNSIDNIQCGAGTTDGTPDTWIRGVYCYVEWVDGTAPSTDPKFPVPIIWFNE